MEEDIYQWPDLLPADESDRDQEDLIFAEWAYRVRTTLQPVYSMMHSPMPDDVTQLDNLVTQEIDGWLPRVAALAVKAEYFLRFNEARLWPPQITMDGEKLTVADRDHRYETALAPYRFVRDELDALTKRMVDRVRWAQSVRKQQGDAQGF